MTEDQLAVAQRLIDERVLERFSQVEIAAEIGVTRAALASFELGHNPLSFSVGFAFCRRLDLSPRWLATGEEPRRPFTPLPELGLSLNELRRHMRRGVDFLSGYERTLRGPIDEWLKKNPPEKLIARQFRGGVEPLARRFSNAELVAQLRRWIETCRHEEHSDMRGAAAQTLDVLVEEVSARLDLRQGRPRKQR